MQPAKDIEQRRPYALIVGGSSGIGFEIARRFLARDIDVAIVARRKRRLQTAAEKLQMEASHGEAVLWAVGDATNTASIASCIDDINRKKGPPRFCCFLMGRPDPRYFRETGEATFQAQLDENYVPVVNCVCAIRPILIEAKPCALVFASSFLALLPMPGFSAYTAAKSAVLGLAKSLHVEFWRTPVSVTCIAPTAVNTPGFAEEEQTTEPDLIALQKALPLLDPQKVASETVEAMIKERFLVVPGWRAKLLHTAQRCFPRSTDQLLSVFGPQARAWP